MSQKGASIGVIGGSGFYKFLQTTEASKLETPYGTPSARVRLSDVKGKRVAFIPRHGERHEFPPHVVPYRANLHALKQLGVERVYGPTAVGSLKGGIAPGDFVISDQFVNLTSGRKDTFYEGPGTAFRQRALARLLDVTEIVSLAERATGADRQRAGRARGADGDQHQRRGCEQ